MIVYSIFGRGQAPKKVIGVDLFYLSNMDRGSANNPYLLAQYLFRHAEGRKSEARLSGGHFIRRLAAHFGLPQDQRSSKLLWLVPLKPLRMLLQLIRVLRLFQHPCRHLSHRHPLLSTRLCHRGSKGSKRSYMTQLIDASGRTYQEFNSTLVGSSQMPYHRRVRPKTGDASTSTTPRIDDQPDP
nr:hypothetical protein [Tanacetum cinerariifolium]